MSAVPVDVVEAQVTESAQQITDFKFEGLLIDRLIVHRVFSRSPDKQFRPPKCGTALIILDDARNALQKRITEALGSRSHGTEMSIENTDVNSFFQNGAGMLRSDEPTFINLSKQLADALGRAQLLTNAPGGILAIIRGRVGNDGRPFLAAIKAETQDGFRAEEQGEAVTMQYIRDLLLTPTQRLYKIGVLIETSNDEPGSEGYNPANYRVFLFDHLMTSTETRNAASYFFSSFLGLSMQASSKKLTRDFFEWTKEYINTASPDMEVRVEMQEALQAELRSNQTLVSTYEFAERHLPQQLRQDYLQLMQSKGFPQNSVVKDTHYIQTKLRSRRKVFLSSGVQLSAPPDSFASLVHQVKPTEDMESIFSDPDYTVFRIKGTVLRHE